MATTGAEDTFIDTNILVRSTVLKAPLHSEARQAIQDRQDLGSRLWVSQQVLREYMVNLTRPQTYADPPPVEVVLADVRDFQRRFSIAEDSPAVMEKLLELIGQIPIGGKQVHDANIVATMLVHGIPALLTHNVSDYNRFRHLITIVPLVP